MNYFYILFKNSCKLEATFSGTILDNSSILASFINVKLWYFFNNSLFLFSPIPSILSKILDKLPLLLICL